jgi:hypothetical protein
MELVGVVDVAPTLSLRALHDCWSRWMSCWMLRQRV